MSRLAPIYGWFTEGFDTVKVKEAMALLEQLVSSLIWIEEAHPMLLWNKEQIVLFVARRAMTFRTELYPF